MQSLECSVTCRDPALRGVPQQSKHHCKSQLVMPMDVFENGNSAYSDGKQVSLIRWTKYFDTQNKREVGVWGDSSALRMPCKNLLCMLTRLLEAGLQEPLMCMYTLASCRWGSCTSKIGLKGHLLEEMSETDPVRQIDDPRSWRTYIRGGNYACIEPPKGFRKQCASEDYLEVEVLKPEHGAARERPG